MAAITLDQVKAHLRVDFPDDDDLITAKLAAAKAWIQDYTASDPDADSAPLPIGEAVMQLTAHLYENREASLVRVTAQQLPLGFLDLLAAYRAFAF